MKRVDKAAETSLRSNGGRGSVTKPKINGTPRKSNFESKREFFKNYFNNSKLGADCGKIGQLVASTNFTNPLFIVKHSRLPSSQWDEPIGTGSRQLAVYEGNTRHRLEEPGNSQE